MLHDINWNDWLFPNLKKLNGLYSALLIIKTPVVVKSKDKPIIINEKKPKLLKTFKYREYLCPITKLTIKHKELIVHLRNHFGIATTQKDATTCAIDNKMKVRYVVEKQYANGKCEFLKSGWKIRLKGIK